MGSCAGSGFAAAFWGLDGNFAKGGPRDRDWKRGDRNLFPAASYQAGGGGGVVGGGGEDLPNIWCILLSLLEEYICAWAET